jgi:hypothetical protein
MRKVIMFSMLVTAGLILFCHFENARAATMQKAKPQSQQSRKTTMKNEKKDEAVFMCRLDALDTAERARYQELRKQLHAGVQEVKELPNGYAFRLSADSRTILLAAEWITFERRCCPFFNFALDIESEKQSLWLNATGREGVKAFMQLEMGVR